MQLCTEALCSQARTQNVAVASLMVAAGLFAYFCAMPCFQLQPCRRHWQCRCLLCTAVWSCTDRVLKQAVPSTVVVTGTRVYPHSRVAPQGCHDKATINQVSNKITLSPASLAHFSSIQWIDCAPVVGSRSYVTCDILRMVFRQWMELQLGGLSQLVR